MIEFLQNFLTFLADHVDALGVFSLGAVALIAKWLITFRVFVDLFFISNKPLFFKIMEARKARKGAGGGGAAGGNPAEAAANAVTGVATGIGRSIVESGGLDGLLIYILSYAPDLLMHSSYVDAKTGEIIEEEAANATLATWFATKSWKIIGSAALLSLVSVGLLVDMSNNLATGLNNRSKDIANMVNFDGMIDNVIGSSENLLVADNDKTMLGLIKRETIEKALNQGVDPKYKYTADNRTALRNYIEEIVVTSVDASELAKLNFVKQPYNPQIMSYSTHVYKRQRAQELATVKENTAISSGANTNTDTYSYFAIIIPQVAGDYILCDDKNYETVELLVEMRAQTSKTSVYFDGGGNADTSDSRNIDLRVGGGGTTGGGTNTEPQQVNLRGSTKITGLKSFGVSKTIDLTSGQRIILKTSGSSSVPSNQTTKFKETLQNYVKELYKTSVAAVDFKVKSEIVEDGYALKVTLTPETTTAYSEFSLRATLDNTVWSLTAW